MPDVQSYCGPSLLSRARLTQLGRAMCRPIALAVVATSSALQTGCAAQMALQQPLAKDVSVLNVGTGRDRVIAEFGQPVWTDSGEGRYVDLHVYTQGYPDHIKKVRAAWHTFGDLASFGLWELAGIPLERWLNGTDYAVEISYDSAGSVQSVTEMHEDRVQTLMRVLGMDKRAGDRPRIGPTSYDKKIALVVGIDNYPHTQPLKHARLDAKNIATALAGMGFEVHALYDEQATRSAILRFLGETLSERATANSLAVVYFAGHGHTDILESRNLSKDQRTRGYILPYDGDPQHAFATAISMGTLNELRYRIGAKHLYYIMDSCYSGLGLATRRQPDEEQNSYYDLLASSAGVTMMTAGRAGEQAFETPTDGGIFSKAFLAALSGRADEDGDFYVTAAEIARYVRQAVHEVSRGRQTPQYGSLDGGGEPMLPIAEPTIFAQAQKSPTDDWTPRGDVPRRDAERQDQEERHDVPRPTPSPYPLPSAIPPKRPLPNDGPPDTDNLRR